MSELQMITHGKSKGAWGVTDVGHVELKIGDCDFPSVAVYPGKIVDESKDPIGLSLTSRGEILLQIPSNSKGRPFHYPMSKVISLIEASMAFGDRD